MNRKGFSLIELMIVIAIIGILSGQIFTNADFYIDKSKKAVYKKNQKVIRKAIDDYFTDNSKYPNSLNDLVKENYLREIPIDPFTQKPNWKTISKDKRVQNVYDIKSRIK